MVEKLEIEEFISRAGKFPVIDVRSPSEFKQGHICGAINLPLFSDEERKEIGIKYKKSGREPSVILGLEITGPKLSAFVKTAKKLSGNKEVLIYCWRGGMRSESLAWLFDLCGIKTFLLINGYKNYRSYIRNSFDIPSKILVLGGMTGSGKTDILLELRKNNQQVLDLEGLANHKGSAFGFIGQEEQPTNEQFENNIFNEWKNFDHTRTIWVEDESISIGKVLIPGPLYNKIRQAGVLRIEKGKELRINKLVKDYTACNKKMLESAIIKISKRLGGLRTKECLQALKDNNFNKVADLSLDYYDQAYQYGLSKRNSDNIFAITMVDNDIERNTCDILSFYKKVINY